MEFVIGIDLGSTGIRGIVTNSVGKVILSKQLAITPSYKARQLPAGWYEQNPKSWIEALHRILKEIVKELKKLGIPLQEISAICTDSTSGTILAVDEFGNPLIPAIMYNDIRAQDEAEKIQKIAISFSQKVGYKFKASFSLPKILWIKQNRPSIYIQTKKFLHANDFLVGLLTGEYFHSDISNCLKAGFDFIDERWPGFIESELEISFEKLPKVVPSGKKIGVTSTELEKNTGFPSGVAVISGATDSIMALIASGASQVGDIFTSLGTTLVTRILTDKLVYDMQGRVYCHIFPGKTRYYLPGGASSVGAECLHAYFPEINFALFDQKALEYFPTNGITYPLVKKGERFPFVNPDAEHFYMGTTEIYEKYTAYLQGVAFVERLSIEILERLGVKTGSRVFTIGGATKSRPWLQIRADVLQKTIYRPKIIEAAYGAAILAASATIYKEDVLGTIKKFVQPDIIIKPRIEFKEKLTKNYKDFCAELMKRFNFKIE